MSGRIVRGGVRVGFLYMWYLYVLLCVDGTYYTGITTDTVVLVTVTTFYLAVFGLEDASWSGGGLKPSARFGFSAFTNLKV